MKRPEKSVQSQSGVPDCPDMGFASKFPNITAMMMDGHWDDGKVRELSTLSINFSQGSVNLGIVDKALRCTGYTTAESLAAALGLAEEALAAGRLMFRPWAAEKQRKG